jgi:hypothetical protein
VRLCGSVAILTAHKFQSHVSYLLIFPTSHPLSFPQSQIQNPKSKDSTFPPGPLPARRLIGHRLTGRRVGPAPTASGS